MTMKKFIISSGLISCAAALISVPQTCAQNASTPEQTGPYPSLEIREVTVIDGSGAPAFGPVFDSIRSDRIRPNPGLNQVVNRTCIPANREKSGIHLRGMIRTP